MIGTVGVRIWLATAAVVGRKEFDTLCGIVCQALGTPSACALNSNAAISIPGSLLEDNASAAVVITGSPGRHYALITIVPPGTGANLDVQRSPSGQTRSKYLPDSAQEYLGGVSYPLDAQQQTKLAPADSTVGTFSTLVAKISTSIEVTDLGGLSLRSSCLKMPDR